MRRSSSDSCSSHAISAAATIFVEAAKRNASESAAGCIEQRRQSEKSKLTAHLEHELYYAEEDMMTAERLANGSPTNPAYQREMRAATQRYRVLASDLKGARSR